MNRNTWIAVTVLVAIAATYVLFFRKTDEDRMRDKLRALAEAVHKDEGENEMIRAMRVEKAFVRIFTREVEIKIPEVSEGKKTRHDLATMTIGAGHEASKIALRYESVRVEVDRRVQRGWVTATAIATGTRLGGGGHVETRDVVIRFDREEDEWKIGYVSTAGAER